MKKPILTLTFELTLPQRIYPHLDRLFSVFKSQVNSFVPKLWNEEGFKLLSQKGHANGILIRVFKSPKGVSHFFFRNVLELTGQIIRSHLKKKEAFEKLLREEDVSDLNDFLVLNVKKQIENLRKKKREVNSYFDLPCPTFGGNVVIASADYSIEKGQFRKLKIGGNFLTFEIKVPTPKGWKWIKTKKLLPEKLRRFLRKAKEVKSPLIKKERLKSGYTIYKLVIPLVFEVKEPQNVERVLAIDLSPSEKRLGVGVIVDDEFVSKPIFFKTKLFRKAERIYDEVNNLERKIDHVFNAMVKTTKKREKERLRKRLNHLFGERKRKWLKIKNLRKQILEIFTNLVVAHAKAYHCQAIAVEKLRFESFPKWKDSKTLKKLSQWFYAKFLRTLENKAKLFGLRVVKVSSFNNSKTCAKCGKIGKLERLTFKCSCGTYDRDYNASLNVAIRALRPTKSKAYMAEDIPGRLSSRLVRMEGSALLTIISLFKLLTWLKVVQTCYLKPQKLFRWINSDKYD